MQLNLANPRTHYQTQKDAGPLCGTATPTITTIPLHNRFSDKTAKCGGIGKSA